MDIKLQNLEWDSDFFGVRVHKIIGEIKETADYQGVGKALNESLSELAYYSSENKLRLENNLEKYYIEPVDGKITYSKKLSKDYKPCNLISSYTHSFPSEVLVRLAIESGIYSRYNIDKKIGREKYEELYKLWIINSVNKEIAQEVLVYQIQSEIVGFVTLKLNGKIAEIGIIAVDKNFRGQGIGKALMQEAENWFINHGGSKIQVTTQLKNIPASKLYERCGYNIESKEYCYHIWRIH